MLPSRFMKFPVFFPVTGNFPYGEGFESDCVIRQPVSDFRILCGKLEISAHARAFFFDLRAPEKVYEFAGFRIGGRFDLRAPERGLDSAFTS
jgi:hypothetical protein